MRRAKEDDPRLAPPGERERCGEYDCLGKLRETQEEGWDGRRMALLLRLHDQKDIYGRKGGTSYFCDSESAPLIDLRESRDPAAWPPKPAAWSVALHESNTSVYCTFVDLDRVVGGVRAPIIVRAQIGGAFSSQNWGEFFILVREAEDAAKAASEKDKRFSAALNDCGRMALVKMK